MFELTESQIQEFAVHKASYLPEQIRTSRTFQPAIREHVRSLSELAEPTVCARRQEFMQSELDLDEFRERVLFQDGAKVIVGGVRFKNLDPNFPFVELNANFDLFESTVIEDAAAVAGQQFGSFAPKGILIVGAPDVAVSSASSAGATLSAAAQHPSAGRRFRLDSLGRFLLKSISTMSIGPPTQRGRRHRPGSAAT